MTPVLDTNFGRARPLPPAPQAAGPPPLPDSIGPGSDGISADSGHPCGRLVAEKRPTSRPGDRPNLVGRRSFPGRKVQERADGRQFPLAEPTDSAPGGRLSALGKFVVAQPEASHRRRKEAPTRRKANLPSAEGASPRDEPGDLRTRTARQLPSCWRVAARAPAVSDSKIVGHRTAARAGSLGIACGESWSLNIDYHLAGCGPTAS